MKKYILLLFTLVSVLSYGQDNNATPNGEQQNAEGVVINGVKWATRNVDAPGTFAATPESAGKLYQWNRKKDWTATRDTINDWDNTTPKGTTWSKANDPSPAGWRIPTINEIQTLLDKGKVNNEWTTVNGVNGRKFTDKTSGNSIFFPAVGYRNNDGTLLGTGSYGDYWSSSAYVGNDNETWAYSMSFSTGSALWFGYSRSFGFSVRCVAE